MAKTTRRAASKAEALADTLRLAIASGEFPANSLLPGEVDLMEQHNISRPTYREAIRVLEAEGLLTVERGPRGGHPCSQADDRADCASGRLLLPDAAHDSGRGLSLIHI